MPVDIDAVVLSNDRLSAAYNVLTIAASAIAVSSRPGQFVMVKTTTPAATSAPLLRRPFSVFEVTRGSDTGEVHGLSLLNKTVGVVTSALYALEPGQHLQCLGPLGRPFSQPPLSGDAWMVAGGVGLAPFLTHAEILCRRGVRTTLFYGARSAAELYFLERFEEIGVRTVVATEDGSRGHRGFITAPLAQALENKPPERDVTVYACGPTGMMRAVAGLATQHGRQCEVSLEQTMGCGLGGCYSCVVPVLSDNGPTRLVRSCLEGPVFPGDRISWSTLP